MHWPWVGLIVLLVVVTAVGGYVLGANGGDDSELNPVVSSVNEGTVPKGERECVIAFNTSKAGQTLSKAIAEGFGEDPPNDAWVGLTPDGVCAVAVEEEPGRFEVLQGDQQPGSDEVFWGTLPGYEGEESGYYSAPSVTESDLAPWMYPFNATVHTSGLWLTSAEQDPEF
jgi:hypothetical protein